MKRQSRESFKNNLIYWFLLVWGIFGQDSTFLSRPSLVDYVNGAHPPTHPCMQQAFGQRPWKRDELEQRGSTWDAKPLHERVP